MFLGIKKNHNTLLYTYSNKTLINLVKINYLCIFSQIVSYQNKINNI